LPVVDPATRHGGAVDMTRAEQLPLPIEAERATVQADTPQMGGTAAGVLAGMLILLLPGSILLWGYQYRGWFRSNQSHPNFRFTEMSDFTLEGQEPGGAIDSAIAGAIQDDDSTDNDLDGRVV